MKTEAKNRNIKAISGILTGTMILGAATTAYDCKRRERQQNGFLKGGGYIHKSCRRR